MKYNRKYQPVNIEKQYEYFKMLKQRCIEKKEKVPDFIKEYIDFYVENKGQIYFNVNTGEYYIKQNLNERTIIS